MAAPRCTSLRALRVLSQQHSASPCLRRNLHITGAHSAQPANAADKSTLYQALSVGELKQECRKRSLRAAGGKPEVRNESRHCNRLDHMLMKYSSWNVFSMMIP